MAGKNQDASKSNNHNGVQIGGPKDNGNVGHGNTGTANIGNENVGSHNVGNGNTGSNFVGDPLPGVDSAPLFIPGADASINKQSNDATYTGA